MKNIRVMIVEDSAVVRALLEYSIGRDPRLEVCATAATAEDALAQLEQRSPDVIAPDVIAMDIRLPGIDGLEATRRIMSKNPIPIVVVAASVESKKWNTTAMEALRAGALTVLEKPVGTTNADYEALAQRLCTQSVIMSQVKLVHRHREPDLESSRIPRCSRSGSRGFKMLGIACSTGGPGALVQLLEALGSAFPLPILLVQHMTASFLDAFASWLGRISPFSAAVVNDCSIPVVRRVHMAPPEWHLRLEGGRLRLGAGDPISFHRPSGTVLFQSMARDLGAEALGVLLTGMGDDGAAGLLEIRRSGGFTIAEDESTAVVYGMPAAAVRMGAVCESLPLPAIAPRVLELVSCKNP
jgi:two-component system, chemotaxis family, protein-glutamate methylesterase/glutaminase